MPIKLVELIKMCLNETCNKVRIRKHLPDAYPIQIGLKRDDLLPLLFNFDLEYASQYVRVLSPKRFKICQEESSRKSGRTGIGWNTKAPGLS
jgi:hypothetical protein